MGKTEGYLAGRLAKLIPGGRTLLQRMPVPDFAAGCKNFCAARIKNGNLLANKVGLCYTSR